MKVLFCLLALAAVQALRLKYSANDSKNEGLVQMSPLKEANYGSISMNVYEVVI